VKVQCIFLRRRHPVSIMEENQLKVMVLEGIRVLDLANESASFASKILADLGAQVVKIEKPGGDVSRQIGPFLDHSPHPEKSLFFLYHNMGKMSITLNLEHESSQEIFMRLLEKADVLIETYDPGYLTRLGLGLKRLQERNPRLILTSITGFGQDGPRSRYKSCDLVTAAYGGQMSVSGLGNTPPLKPFGEQSYYASSLYAALAILLALRKRKRTGKGEHIDISHQEVAVSTLGEVMIRFFYEKMAAPRQGGLYGNGSFCILSCKNGHLLLTPFFQWETLVEWLEGEGMAEDLGDKRYLEEDYRRQNLSHVLEVLERWTKNHTTAELFELGQSMRFPWAPVQTPREVLGNPHLQARGFFRKLDHVAMGRSLPYPTRPHQSRNLATLLARAPNIGEHNNQIYLEELGFSPDDLQELIEMGAI
jgi:benzylsuccinate CoA-transferase BbsE subunit